MADNVGAELTLHNGANGNALNGNNITQELRFSDADYNEVYNNSVQRFFVQQAKRNVIANNAADTLEVQRVSDSTLDAVQWCVVNENTHSRRRRAGRRR